MKVYFTCKKVKRSKKIMYEQRNLMKERCDGKQSCVAQACPDFWNLPVSCDSDEKVYMRVTFKCVGGEPTTEEIEAEEEICGKYGNIVHRW